ncbi:MAG: N-6 DNA methylase [Anaerolineales bacterium]|nr:N-6 DNA methylase [Anaerolineales bacterium]
MMAFSQLGFSFAQGTHQNHFLFSDHYLNNLLPKQVAWEAGREETAVFSQWLRDLYQQERDNLPGYNEAQLEDHWIRPILDKLGWEGTAETQAVIPALTAANIRKPDYVLFPTVAARQAAAGRQNSPDYAQEAVAVGEAKRWTAALDKKVRGGAPNFDNNNPSYQIDYYLRATNVTWGVLTNGRLWRLVHRESSYKLDVYFEIDLETAVQTNSLAALRYFTLFFGRSSFLPDKNGRIFLHDALSESVRYARELEADLRDNAYKALEQIITGFFALERNQLDPANPDHLQQVYTNSLYLLYRLLFLLYGESRGLLPLGNEQYYNHSLTALVKDTDPALGKQTRWNPYTRQVWVRLSDLFHLINGANPNMNQLMGVPRYNGGLFSPVLHPFLEEKAIGDSYLVQAVDYLARRDSHKQGDYAVKEPVDYRTLGVRQLGSIYEGLLEYAPRAATEPMVTVRRKGQEMWLPAAERGKAKALEQRQVGELYLATDKGERKATGSYYTPDYIVKYMVEQTLNPLIEEARQRVKEGAAGQDSAQANAQRFIDEILALNVLDPAMGSGHFLVEATDHLARALATDEWVQGESGSDDAEADLVYWRRRVAEACIYGVDKNPMAVELAKLSLWLVTVAKDKPLSFLDHHLRHGDSLVGARLADLVALPDGKKGAASEQQLALLNETTLAQDLFRAVGGMSRIEGMLSESLADVYAKEEILAELRQQLAGWRTLADVWTSSFFGNAMSPEEYREVARHLQGEATGLSVAQLAPFLQHAAVTDNDYFHWELAFPEVFFDIYGRSLADRAGFDAVIGNPPYDELSAHALGREILEKEFFQNIDHYAPALTYRVNLFRLFMMAGLDKTRQKGKFSYIVPMSLLGDRFTYEVRSKFLLDTKIEQIIAFPQKDSPSNRVFPDAKLSTCIIVCTNDKLSGDFLVVTHPGREILDDSPSYWANFEQISRFDPDNYAIPTVGQADWALAVNLVSRPELCLLREIASSSPGEIMFNKQFQAFLQDSPPGEIVLRGAHIGRYEFYETPKQGTPVYLDKESFLEGKTDINSKAYAHQNVRIAYQRGSAIDNYRRIIATFLEAGVFCSDTVGYFSESKYDLLALLAIINSRVPEWRFGLTSSTNHVNPYELDVIPVPRIEFVTSLEDRQKYLSDWIDKYHHSLSIANDVISDLGVFVGKARNDKVHDLLAYLSKQMLEYKRSLQKLVNRFWLDLEGVAGDEFANLQKGKWEESLHKEVAAARPFVRPDSRSTRTLEEALGWNEAAFRGFVRLLLGKVKGLADMVEVYNSYHADYAALVQRIAATDALIDQIVYKLYGLTDEEIAIVEGAV